MSVPSIPFSVPSPPPAPRGSGWSKAAVALVIVILLAALAWREGLIRIPGLAPSSDAPPWWQGVWFAQKGGGGYELPGLQLDRFVGLSSPVGRLITPGIDQDVGRALSEVTANADSLTFVTVNGAERTRYLLIATAPDAADLFLIDDASFNLTSYLRASSVANREKLFRDLNAPKEPERIARLIRVNMVLPTPSGSSPTFPRPASPKGATKR